MLLFDVTDDNKWIRLIESDDLIEEKQIEVSFTKKVSNWNFKKKKFKFDWDGYVKLYKKVGGYYWLPIGLWNQIFEMGKKHSIDIKIKGLDRIFLDIDKENFYKFSKDITKKWTEDTGKKPRKYQIEAAYNILKYRYSLSEISTSGGKTLISYLVFSWLFANNKINRFLMIVPNEGLILQGEEDFEEYGIFDINKKIKMGKIYGKSKKPVDDCNLVIGTYQSLTKRDSDFLDKFDCVFVDEAHQTSVVSIKRILSMMKHCNYKFGMSGTLPNKNNADHFTIESLLGPIVNNISPNFLENLGYTTPVNIKVVKLNYLDDETKNKLNLIRKSKNNLDGTQSYNLEKKIVINNEKRLNFISNFISKASKNSLILFQSVAEGYGKSLYNILRNRFNNREIFYVDGSTPSETRDIYKKKMESGSNKLLIATFGTFSTGISINNIHNIFFIESYKSEILIKQSIGRGMRLHDDKTKVNIIDFVDDFSIGKSKNYLLKHSQERIKIYKKEKFTYSIYDINL